MEIVVDCTTDEQRRNIAIQSIVSINDGQEIFVLTVVLVDYVGFLLVEDDGSDDNEKKMVPLLRRQTDNES